MTTRAEQKGKRREEILYAALDLFIRRGYAATKIKDIAQAAGMSVGLLFHYFASKEELFIELIRLGTSAPIDMVGRLSKLPPLEFFEMCAKSTLAFATQSEFTAKMFVLMGSVYYNEGIPEAAREIAVTVDFYRSLVPVVEAGQKQGTIRPGNPLALSTAFWGALIRCISDYALNPGFPLPEAEWIVDIIRVK